MATKKETLNELFEKLEGITKTMENEEISLEETFSLYSDGMKVLKKCNDTIDKIEKKVQLLDEKGETHDFQ